MGRGFSRSISERSARATLFVFFSLLVFGTAFFVFADDDSNGKNIFQDSDQDGLSNDEEKLYGTDPNNRDSDGDGYRDGVEGLIVSVCRGFYHFLVYAKHWERLNAGSRKVDEAYRAMVTALVAMSNRDPSRTAFAIPSGMQIR